MLGKCSLRLFNFLNLSYAARLVLWCGGVLRIGRREIEIYNWKLRLNVKNFVLLINFLENNIKTFFCGLLFISAVTQILHFPFRSLVSFREIYEQNPFHSVRGECQRYLHKVFRVIWVFTSLIYGAFCCHWWRFPEIFSRTLREGNF